MISVTPTTTEMHESRVFQFVMKKTTTIKSLCEIYFFNKLPLLDICLTRKFLISSYQRLGVFLIQFNSGKLISSSLSISYLSARIMKLFFIIMNT